MSYESVKSPDDLRRLVIPGETRESEHLEFKKEPYRWHGQDRREQAVEACRDIVQFANADGGALVVGVSEATTPDGRRVAGEIVGCPEVDGLADWIEQAIQNHLDPPSFPRALDVIAVGDRSILAVNVTPSLPLVALTGKDDSDGLEYIRRSGTRKVWMSPADVAGEIARRSSAGAAAVAGRHADGGTEGRQTGLASRMAERLKEVFAKTKRDQPVDLEPPPQLLLAPAEAARAQLAGRPTVVPLYSAGCRPIWHGLSDEQISLTIFFAGLLEPCIELPIDLVRAAWITSDGRAALSFAVRIVLHPKGDPSGYHLDRP